MQTTAKAEHCTTRLVSLSKTFQFSIVLFVTRDTFVPDPNPEDNNLVSLSYVFFLIILKLKLPSNTSHQCLFHLLTDPLIQEYLGKGKEEFKKPSSTDYDVRTNRT